LSLQRLCMPTCPKVKRIENKELVEKVRSIGYCMLSGRGECCGGLDVHHIRSRGSGGDDVPDNMILVCRCHHQRIHNGLIQRAELYEALRKDKYLHLHSFE